MSDKFLTQSGLEHFLSKCKDTFSAKTHTHDYIESTMKGAANGVASLDSSGLVPSSQLPSYVDDVLEYSAKSSFPSTGETGKIYVDTSTNLTYRWSGSAYVEISKSLALGETSSTAYAGDKGATLATNLSSHTGDTTVHITSSERTSWNGKYAKPSGGIPKTDLASAVQTSLGKADTALQGISASTTGSGNAVTSVTASGNSITVTKGTTFLTEHQDISSKENTSNKVSAWSATTTDTHYPSEKLVKTALDTHTHLYAGSSSAGGPATNASKVGNCSVETSLTTTSDDKIPTSKAIADFVAASTECGDNYIKFANGIAICWGSYTGSENLSFTAWGNSYKATSSKQITFPITFGITPSVILSPSTSANDYTITKYSCSKTGFGNLSISKATSSSGTFDVAFNYVAVGSTIEHYDVTYDTSGGVSIASDLKKAGVTVTIPSTSKTGYTLSGWTSKQVTVSKNGDTYTFVMPGMNVTLTANWLGNPHTVTYNTDGGSSISSESKRTGDSVTIPTTTKTNYALTGWTSSQVTVTKSGSSYIFTMPNSDVTVEATWVYQLAGNIMYSLNGGSAQTLPSTLSLKTTDSITFSYSFTNSSYKPANPTYSWSYGGSVVSTSATYTPVLAEGTRALVLSINGASVGTASLTTTPAEPSEEQLPIGGAIFYDAGDNGATYTFYDSNGDVISDTSISGLQNAVSYKVSGTPTKDRFYAVYPTRLNGGDFVYWGFYRNADIKSSGGNIVNTGTAIGTGKTATQAILNYIDTYASSETASTDKPSSDISQSSHDSYNLYKNCGTSYNYLWDVFRDWKSTSPEGLDDWFIPSKDELNQIASNASIISSAAPEISNEVSNGYIWSSSAYSSSRRVWFWSYSTGKMTNRDRYDYFRVVACRAF